MVKNLEDQVSQLKEKNDTLSDQVQGLETEIMEFKEREQEMNLKHDEEEKILFEDAQKARIMCEELQEELERVRKAQETSIEESQQAIVKEEQYWMEQAQSLQKQIENIQKEQSLKERELKDESDSLFQIREQLSSAKESLEKS